MQISFVAYLKAAPQGSKRHVGKGIMIESSKEVGPYRHNLAIIAKKAVDEASTSDLYSLFNLGIGLTLDFYFLKPKSAKNRKYPSVKPDLDKLIRSTCDALTGILYKDDSQICEISARKHYCTTERVEISCYSLSPSKPKFKKEVEDGKEASFR